MEMVETLRSSSISRQKLMESDELEKNSEPLSDFRFRHYEVKEKPLKPIQSKAKRKRHSKKKIFLENENEVANVDGRHSSVANDTESILTPGDGVKINNRRKERMDEEKLTEEFKACKREDEKNSQFEVSILNLS